MELGNIRICIYTSAVELRKKIDYTIRGLGMEPLPAARITTVFSDMVRLIRENQQEAMLTCSYDPISGGIFTICFSCLNTLPPLNNMERFFSYFNVAQTSQGYEITAELMIPSEAPVDKETLEAICRVVSTPSREELMYEITRKNQALTEAKCVAESAAQAKADFLANMSHEIRTPMNAIMGMTYLLQKTEMSDKQVNYTHKIQNSSKHLLGVINDILDFSKIEAGKLDIEYIDFRLSEVLDNLSNFIGNKCIEKGLELIFDVDPYIADYLKGDPLRIGQILINYANNAVKFTTSGEIIIKVREGERKGSQSVLRFEVQDTGVGIKEDQIDKLFSSFQQADTSTTRKFGGTGLGLAISKKLAGLMEGDVGVISSYGEGSTFWFTVTVDRAEEALIDKINSLGYKGTRVLVVDDNEHFRLVIRNMLEAIEFRVDEANDGHQAEALVRTALNEKDPYEILYIDYQMPGMNGVETAQSVGVISGANPPKCIMITGYGREEVLTEAGIDQIQSVLIKPVNPMVFFEATLNALGEEAMIFEETGRVTESLNIQKKMAPIYKARILVVEDNEINQEIAVELLGEALLLSEIAENGQVAVEKVKDNHYDLVLMDMQMPVMDGIEATELIRRDPSNVKLPIIALSANVMSADRERCSGAGMNDYLAKPLDPLDLYDMLLKWVDPKEIKRDEGVSEEDMYIFDRGTKKVNNVGKVMTLEDFVFEGLDINMGMKRVMGNKTLYLKLIRKFIDSNTNVVEAIKAHLVEEDIDTATRLAHTLKGVAGNIGAVDVQKASEKLEHGLKSGCSVMETQTYIDQVDDKLSKLMRHLTIMREKVEGQKGISIDDQSVKEMRTASREEMQALLRELKPHVAARKPKGCKEVIAKFDGLVWPEEHQETLKNLNVYVTKYKFKQAMPIIEELEMKI